MRTCTIIRQRLCRLMMMRCDAYIMCAILLTARKHMIQKAEKKKRRAELTICKYTTTKIMLHILYDTLARHAHKQWCAVPGAAGEVFLFAYSVMTLRFIFFIHSIWALNRRTLLCMMVFARLVCLMMYIQMCLPYILYNNYVYVVHIKEQSSHKPSELTWHQQFAKTQYEMTLRRKIHPSQNTEYVSKEKTHRRQSAI